MRAELSVQGTVTAIEGPLLFLKRNIEVGLNEAVEVLRSDGPPRLGRIAVLDQDVMVIEVLESTIGLDLRDTRVRFRGEPLHVGLGPGLLGRIFNGVGQPADGGPPVAAKKRMRIDGATINPALRDLPKDFIETGFAAIGPDGRHRNPIDSAKTAARNSDMPRYTERCNLPYAREQPFDLVADVERYPEFLPWLVAAHVSRRDGNTVWVDMEVGTTFLRKRFASRAILERPQRIDIISRDTLFERYHQSWTFQPTSDGGTIVEFSVEFIFRSRLLQLAVGTFLEEAAKTMVTAFKHRARQQYGPNAGRK